MNAADRPPDSIPAMMSGWKACRAAIDAGFRLVHTGPNGRHWGESVHTMAHPDGRRLLVVTAPRGSLICVRVADPVSLWPAGVTRSVSSLPKLARMLDST